MKFLLNLFKAKILYNGMPKDPDMETRRIVVLVNTFNFVGLIFVLVFSVAATLRKDIFIGIGVGSFGLMILVAFFYHRYSKDHITTSRILSIILGIMLMFLLVTGGVANTGPLWFYLFPILSYYLHGLKRGTVEIAVFFGITCVLLLWPGTPLLATAYSSVFISRFLPSLFAIILCSFFYEYSRQKANEMVVKKKEEAEKANQAKSEFLARMSHEIRTPMNGVMGFAEMLLATDLTEQQQDHSRTILDSCNALITILNDILDFSRIEAGESSYHATDFDPEATVRDICELVLPWIGAKPIEVNCTVSDNVPDYIRSDSGKFRQVIVNLMRNATKFTAQGEIELSLEVKKEDTEEYIILVKVRDTGIGISGEKLEEIFDVFQQVDGSVTRNYEGTGLGLSISRQIARILGGDVWAESELGKGSTFYFSCKAGRSHRQGNKSRKQNPGFKPVKREGLKIEADKQTRAIKGAENKKPFHILLAEDNLVNQKLVLFILKKEGYKVTTALNGRQAVEAFNSDPDCFDLILMDIQMPEVDGREATRLIRESGHTIIPIVAMTADAQPENKKKSLEAGMNDYIVKPVKSDMILNIINKWCC